MQHPDEGTIHSWLDGALSADEAARVEAHVKECPQCAAAVAEARGFIAASSRILTALDNAPRGVIPAVAPRKRVDPLVWRVAATVMIVAAGTLVVVRNRGGTERSMSAVEEARPATQPTTVAADAVSPPGEVGSGKGEGGSGKWEGGSGKREGGRGKGEAGRVGQNPSRPEVSARDNAASQEVATERGDRRAAMMGAASVAGVAGGAAPVAPMAARSLNRAVEMGAAADLPPLKVVGTPGRIGAKVTLYEVAPGDTVTLTEAVPLNLQSVVTIGAAERTKKAMAAQSKTRGAVPAAAPPTQGETRVLSAPVAAAPAPAPAAQFGTVNGFNTIVWSDPATGSTLTLTGRLPEARLREIKIRIERERAAAAAAKKNP
jgi:hypothetical protein